MKKLILTWDESVEKWKTYLRAAGRSEGTIRLRRSHLQRLQKAHRGRSPVELTAQDLTEWLAVPDWSGDTRRSHRATLVGFYGWLSSTGQISVNPAAALPSAKARRGRPRPAGDDVIKEALAAADDRDALMIRLGAYAGMRSCEMATLHSDRLFQDLDGWSVTVIGKGGKLRDIPLNPRLALDLRARPEGWVFPGRIDGHLSASYISKRLSWALGEGVTGHQLRHRFASSAFLAERDLRAVQELLGHSSPETTAIYTAVPDQALRRAVMAAAS